MTTQPTKTTDSSPWWASTTFIAAIAAITGAIAGAFGVDPAAFSDAITGLGEAIVAAIGALISLIAVITAGRKKNKDN